MTRRQSHFAPIQLPVNFISRPVKYFEVERIVLSKGSLDTEERKASVRRVCDAYPTASIEEQLETPHNRVDLAKEDPAQRRKAGKRTMLFGELKDAVRPSRTTNGCPMYWIFSVYAYCPYGCKYCYLSGTRGYLYCPAVKIFVNLPEIIGTIDWRARQCGQAVGFCIGKLQDGLALDPLTNFSSTLVPFFAQHRHAHQIVLTKSASVENLLELDHRQKTILAWSLLPPTIAACLEENVPSVDERIAAMKRCADAGYPVRAMLMPIVPHECWKDEYVTFVSELVERVPLQRLTLGGCIFSQPSTVSLRSGWARRTQSRSVSGG